MKSTLKLALVGFASAVTSAAFAQTISVAGPFNFQDTLAGAEAGLNSVVGPIAPVTTAYLFGSNVTVNSINVTSVAVGTWANEGSVRMVNSGYPTLLAYVNFSSTAATFTSFAISTPTVRYFTANTLYGANIQVGSTWTLTFFDSADDGAGPDETGTGLVMTPASSVPPPARTPWASVAGNTLPILYDNGTIVNAPGLGAGGLDASTYANVGGTVFGFTSLAPTFKLADDFTVPAGGWTINGVSAFGYQTNAVASPYVSCLVEIWDGYPALGTSSVIASSTAVGDNVFSNAYRVGPTTLTNAARMVWRVQSLFSNVSLPQGTYWITYQMNVSAGGSFTPYVTSVPSQPAGVYPGNAIQQTAPGVWAYLLDAGTPADVPFLVHGFATPPANQNLTGTLVLGDTSGSFGFNRNIAYSVMQGTSTVASGTITASASSSPLSISVPNSVTGASQLVLDGSSFLKRVINVNLTGSNQAIGSATMQNGDVDASGEVDAVDIDLIIASFGLTTDISEDVDVSGEVDAVDIDIVIANFGGLDQ